MTILVLTQEDTRHGVTTTWPARSRSSVLARQWRGFEEWGEGRRRVAGLRPKDLRGAPERQLVRFALDLVIDLGAGIEIAVEHTPARHPVPCPARLVLRNRRRLAELDAAEVEVVGRQCLDRGVSSGPAVLEVRHVFPLVGVDATDGLADAPQERGIERGIEVGAGDPRAVKERGRDQP